MDSLAGDLRLRKEYGNKKQKPNEEDWHFEDVSYHNTLQCIVNNTAKDKLCKAAEEDTDQDQFDPKSTT